MCRHSWTTNQEVPPNVIQTVSSVEVHDGNEQHSMKSSLAPLYDLLLAQGRKIEILKKHKLGLLQQLLPQLGETMPKLRFPEFQDSSVWTQVSLGNAFRVIKNGNADTSGHQDDGLYPFFDRINVSNKSQTFLFDAEAVILLFEGKKVHPHYYKGKFNLHQRAYALMEPVVEPRFAFYLLDRFKAILAYRVSLPTSQTLKISLIEKFYISVPNSHAEQHKIADCLTSLDTIINAEVDKLEALQLHKQGLIQKLTPKLYHK
ncbi:MAG: restriction endonuclease subunit S [Bacteroidetes bacterium]|nr:restriction endonuclease subunit S [Bacteroidota bacterium]